MSGPTTCPLCSADLRGDPIPPEHRHYYAPDSTHYLRVIGVEIPGVYDGELYFACPDCGGRWHRWPEGDWRRTAAERYVTREIEEAS